MLCWICFIWGNSLVPGGKSGAMSLNFVEGMQFFLASIHLPYGWVTNLLVRKCAHFSEYAILGFLSCKTFNTDFSFLKDISNISEVAVSAYVKQALFLISIPCVDEIIQLFVPYRCGAITDVLIDIFGIVCSLFIASLYMRYKYNQNVAIKRMTR